MTARQISFCTEARKRTEQNIVLKRRFMSLHGRLADQLKEKNEEIETLRTEVFRLNTEVSSLKSSINPSVADMSALMSTLR